MDILQWLKVIILGIVEGITEWLPISSTGHLILTDALIPMEQSAEFKEMFNVVIQLGAILAVVVLYFGKLWPFRRGKNAPQGTKGLARICDTGKIIMWLKIAVSCVPAAAIGLPLDDWMTEHLYNPPMVASMLIVYGIGFLLIEWYNKRRTPRLWEISEIRWTDALLIGVFQVLALIPGTSRSGATILGGILIGASRGLAAEYTFFLAVPVMFGASLYKIAKFGFAFTGTEIAILLVGMAVAFVVSIIAIKFLMGYIKRHDFSAFGWYRIGLGTLVLLYFYLIR